MTDRSALDDLKAALQASGWLEPGGAIPAMSGDAPEDGHLGVAVEDGTVVALAARWCGLEMLPESLGRLTGLRRLDLSGNRLAALPDSLAALTNLRELNLDANRRAAPPHR